MAQRMPRPHLIAVDLPHLIAVDLPHLIAVDFMTTSTTGSERWSR